jgi:hypothetical protein
LVFLLLYKTASQLTKGATKLIFLILGAVILSNCCSTFFQFFPRQHYPLARDFHPLAGS